MKVLVAVLGMLSLAAYSSDLSQREAGDALSAWLQKSKVSLVVKIGRVGVNCADRAQGVFDDNPEVSVEYKAAQELGWIRVTRDGPGFWKIEPVGLSSAVVESTQHNHHYAANGCDYHLAYIPIADRNLVEVISVKQVDQGNEVKFRWKWVLTPEGKKLSADLPLSLLADTDWRLNNTARMEAEADFTLMDIPQTIAVHEELVVLKRENNEWKTLMHRAQTPMLDMRAWNRVTDSELAEFDDPTRTSWEELMGYGWRVDHHDNGIVYFHTASQNGVLKTGGRASLLLSIVCGPKTLINVNSGTVENGRVRLTFDGAPPMVTKWYQLNEANFGYVAQPLFAKLVNAKTFRVEFTPLGQPPQTAIFNMADFKELFMKEKACHL